MSTIRAAKPYRASSRSEQLREAKRAQRQRERDAGLVHCQLTLPERTAERLRLAVQFDGDCARLDEWLATQVVDSTAWPALASLCWSRSERWISGAEALGLYERNWRLLVPNALDADEAAFVQALAEAHGKGLLLV
jgi:hypothetical protein